MDILSKTYSCASSSGTSLSSDLKNLYSWDKVGSISGNSYIGNNYYIGSTYLSIYYYSGVPNFQMTINNNAKQRSLYYGKTNTAIFLKAFKTSSVVAMCFNASSAPDGVDYPIFIIIDTGTNKVTGGSEKIIYVDYLDATDNVHQSVISSSANASTEFGFSDGGVIVPTTESTLTTAVSGFAKGSPFVLDNTKMLLSTNATGLSEGAVTLDGEDYYMINRFLIRND